MKGNTNTTDLRVAEIESDLSMLGDLITIGYQGDAGTKTVSINLSDVKFVYAVMYYQAGNNYWGGTLMPVSLFNSHPQIITVPLAIDSITIISGIISYDRTTNTMTIKNNNNGWTLYVYKVA